MGYEPKWLRDLRKRKGGPRVIARYQKPRAENEGERLPDFVHETGNEYFRLDKPKPMAYVKCVGPIGNHVWRIDSALCSLCGLTQQAMVAADHPPPCLPIAWYGCDPLGHWIRWDGSLVTEHEDGSISVRVPFENVGPYVPWWQGTLTKGRWQGEVVGEPEPDETTGGDDEATVARGIPEA